MTYRWTRAMVNPSVLARNSYITIMCLVFLPLLLLTMVVAQPLNSVLIQSGGTITYPQTRIEYVMINATATYELSSTFQVITYDTNSLTVLNKAISDVSLLKGSLFVYNGTYQVSGTINMQSNVNMTLQDGVFFNETTNNNIFSFSSVSNSSIFANSNATIHGGDAMFSESAFYFTNINHVTISAAHPNGLIIYNIGYSVMNEYQPGWINNSLFQNIWAYSWMMDTNLGYDWHGIVLDGVQNSQFINLTVDGQNGHSRSPLCIGGWSEPSNNIMILGGIYENGHVDNGIYLGGWNYPVTNINIINVTTYNNDMNTSDPFWLGNQGHSGLKLRPADNVTVTGWNSTNDYYGMEMDTDYGGASNGLYTSGSWYNNITGTINSPYKAGLILDLDASYQNQSVNYNTFNVAINNCTLGSAIWIDNGFPNTPSQISHNTITLNATGNQKQAIDFSASGGNISYNTVYGTFVQNGKGGYPDISFENITAQNYNVINVYSTSGNPKGLYSGNLGTNTVNYPYSGP